VVLICDISLLSLSWEPGWKSFWQWGL
jgi:hypothetical protein